MLATGFTSILRDNVKRRFTERSRKKYREFNEILQALQSYWDSSIKLKIYLVFNFRMLLKLEFKAFYLHCV